MDTEQPNALEQFLGNPRESTIMTLNTKDRIKQTGSLSRPTWDVDDVELEGYHEVAITMAVIPYEQYHVNEKNSWFMFTTVVNPPANVPAPHNVAFHMREGFYDVEQNMEHIVSIIRAVNPTFDMSYDRERSEYTMTSPYPFSLDNMTLRHIQDRIDSRNWWVAQQGLYPKDVKPTDRCLRLFGLLGKTDAVYSNGMYIIKSAIPVTNGRLRSIHISSDMCRQNMASNSGGTDISDIMAVAPVMSSPLEEIVWQAQRPMYYHLPTTPSRIEFRLTDEHGDDLMLHSDWMIQLSFRRNPRKMMHARLDKLYEAIKYIALK